MTGDRGRRTPVSIVCVFNDAHVRSACLDRSIRAGLAHAPQTEYLPVDNTDGRFRSAGAALNDGARRARHDVVVFVHQDVYLHSLVALERAAAALQDDPRTGMVGAVGITPRGTVAGVVRDRVVLIGAPSSPSVDVDSVDEVLFLVERARVVAAPLSEDPDLAWHAYAVEYGARVRREGLRVTTHDVLLTHNSMTTNLDRLSDAHARVAALYPELLPMRTTCGVVRAAPQRGRWRTTLRRRHGAAVWLRESLAAARLARRDGVPLRDVVLGDVRLDVDDALDALGVTGIDVLNLEATAAADPAWSVTSLPRRGRDVAASAPTVEDVAAHLGAGRPGRATLVTGLDEGALAHLSPVLRGVPHLLGLADDTGAWLLCAPGAPGLRQLWPGRRNAAFGLRRRTTPAAVETAGRTAGVGG